MEHEQPAVHSNQMPSGDLVFIAHSHHDHAAAYGLSEWILELWPDVMVYATHTGTTEMTPSGFLHLAPQSRVFLCILSRNCFASNAVFDEVRVAAASQTQGILILHPAMTADDRSEFDWIIGEWQRKLGRAVDLSALDAERILVGRLANALQRQHPERWKEGSLALCLAKERVPPPRRKLPLPDIERVLAGRASREEAVKWLAIQEGVLQDRLFVAGRPRNLIDAPEGSSPEERAVYLLIQVPAETWTVFMRCLRPLMNDEFRKAVTSLFRGEVSRRFPGRLAALHEMSVQIGSEL